MSGAPPTQAAARLVQRSIRSPTSAHSSATTTRAHAPDCGGHFTAAPPMGQRAQQRADAPLVAMTAQARGEDPEARLDRQDAPTLHQTAAPLASDQQQGQPDMRRQENTERRAAQTREAQSTHLATGTLAVVRVSVSGGGIQPAAVTAQTSAPQPRTNESDQVTHRRGAHSPRAEAEQLLSVPSEQARETTAATPVRTSELLHYTIQGNSAASQAGQADSMMRIVAMHTDDVPAPIASNEVHQQSASAAAVQVLEQPNLERRQENQVLRATLQAVNARTTATADAMEVQPEMGSTTAPSRNAARMAQHQTSASATSINHQEQGTHQANDAANAADTDTDEDMPQAHGLYLQQRPSSEDVAAAERARYAATLHIQREQQARAQDDDDDGYISTPPSTPQQDSRLVRAQGRSAKTNQGGRKPTLVLTSNQPLHLRRSGASATTISQACSQQAAHSDARIGGPPQQQPGAPSRDGLHLQDRALQERVERDLAAIRAQAEHKDAQNTGVTRTARTSALQDAPLVSLSVSHRRSREQRELAESADPAALLRAPEKLPSRTAKRVNLTGAFQPDIQAPEAGSLRQPEAPSPQAGQAGVVHPNQTPIARRTRSGGATMEE